MASYIFQYVVKGILKGEQNISRNIKKIMYFALIKVALV